MATLRTLALRMLQRVAQSPCRCPAAFGTGQRAESQQLLKARSRCLFPVSSSWVSSGEYIQMSGRAGRRGLDDKGVVVLMLDGAPPPSLACVCHRPQPAIHRLRPSRNEKTHVLSPRSLWIGTNLMRSLSAHPTPTAEKMEPAVAKEMVQGRPDALYSSFHLTYAMILQLVRSETASPEALMRASFRQFQTERALPVLKQRQEEAEAELAACAVAEEEQVADYLFLQVRGSTHRGTRTHPN